MKFVGQIQSRHTEEFSASFCAICGVGTLTRDVLRLAVEDFVFTEWEALWVFTLVIHGHTSCRGTRMPGLPQALRRLRDDEEGSAPISASGRGGQHVGMRNVTGGEKAEAPC